MTAKFTLAVSGWVIASSGFGCNAPQQQLASAQHSDDTRANVARAALGSLATNPYFSIRVLNSKVCTLASHLAAPPGLKKLAVELELQGVGPTLVPANPFYATLVDDKAQRFESTALGCTPMLAGAPLAKGASARGWVTFDVPEDSVGQALTYEPALVGVRSPRAELELR